MIFHAVDVCAKFQVLKNVWGETDDGIYESDSPTDLNLESPSKRRIWILTVQMNEGRVIDFPAFFLNSSPHCIEPFLWFFTENIILSFIIWEDLAEGIFWLIYPPEV